LLGRNGMKRLPSFLVLAAPLLLFSCGRLLSSPDGGGHGGSSAGTTGSGGTGGGTCTFGSMTYPAGTTFPDLDGCNTCTCTAGGQIACTDRACPPDAAPPVCAFDATYRFGMTGGNAVYEDRATLTPPASYLHERIPRLTDPVSLSCAPPLPSCDAAAVDVYDVTRGVADADVQKALAMAMPPVYGIDPRPYDGSIFSFQRGDGRGFLAGEACTGSAISCVAIPAGVARLVATLRALDEQQLKDASCATLHN
jgi:hypothetical protein